MTGVHAGAGEAARLAHMAGQIGAFFQSWPEDQGVAAIAGHINQFWAPHMRRALLRHFAADPAPLPLRVRRALALIRVPDADQ